MFEKLRKFFEAKKEQHEYNYNVTFDNVAIPEVHTHKSDKHEEEKPKHSPINYENVAIPEVHIRTKKNRVCEIKSVNRHSMISDGAVSS